jgi:hypothetical protein
MTRLFVMLMSALHAFATAGSPDVGVVFAALTPNNTSSERLRLAIKNPGMNLQLILMEHGSFVDGPGPMQIALFKRSY